MTIVDVQHWSTAIFCACFIGVGLCLAADIKKTDPIAVVLALSWWASLLTCITTSVVRLLS